MGSTPLGILTPGNIDCLASGNVFAAAAGLGINVQIAIGIISLIAGILKNNVVTGQLLSCQLVHMRCIKLEAAVFLGLGIVFKPGMIVPEVIQLHKGRRCSFIQSNLCSLRRKLIMSGVALRILLAVAKALDSCLKVGCICVGIVRCHTVCSPVIDISKSQSVQIIDHMLIQILKCIHSLSIMCVNGIKFIGVENIIITAASHRADSLQIIVILDDRHKPGNAALHRCFI